jgi:hypothetical protein
MRTKAQIRLDQASIKLAVLQRKLARWTELARQSAVSTDEYEDLQYQVEHQTLEVELAQLDVDLSGAPR